MADKSPNILLITTDQQRFDTIARAGNPHMITPNFDRLAEGGRLYTHGHSTNPVCIPARHDILTGQPGRFHGYFTNRSVPIADYGLPTLPRLLSHHGYVTGAIGKMHFRPVREHHGFNEMHLMEEIPRIREADEYLAYLESCGYGRLRQIHGARHALYHKPQRALMPEEHHGSAWVAKRTMEFIDENRTRPWFAWASWIAPHPPWDLPASFASLYSNRNLPVRSRTSRAYPFHSDRSDWYGDDEPPEVNRKLREAYYGSISLVDKYVGRLLDHLDETGLSDDTLIIFTSDHGEMLGDKGLYMKPLPYEGCARVPFIVRFPGRVPAGEVSDRFVDSFDVMPTCLDAAGIEYEGSSPLPGESLLRKDGARDRDVQWSGSGVEDKRWAMCRDHRYKYVHWYNRGTETLYDLERDPNEERNLLEGEYPREVYDSLRARCLRSESEWGPKESVLNGEFNDYTDADEFPQTTNSKYPLWAHTQFPPWGPGTPLEESLILEEEIRAVTGGDFSGLLQDKAWRDAWRESWLGLGGRSEFVQEIFPEEGGS